MNKFEEWDRNILTNGKIRTKIRIIKNYIKKDFNTVSREYLQYSKGIKPTMYLQYNVRVSNLKPFDKSNINIKR